MKKKIKYPIEAFALAAVLFSTCMQEAMVIGIGLVFSDVLQCLISDSCSKKYARALGVIGAAVTCAVLYAMCILTGTTPDIRQIAGFAVLGLLTAKHQEARAAGNGEADYDRVLSADACAYGIYVLFAALREYLTAAVVYGFGFPRLPMVHLAFGKPAAAFFVAGLMIALICLVLRSGYDNNAGFWICIPAILLKVPFIWPNVQEGLGIFVGTVIIAALYLGLRQELVLVSKEKHRNVIPMELILLGMIYLVFTQSL